MNGYRTLRHQRGLGNITHGIIPIESDGSKYRLHSIVKKQRNALVVCFILNFVNVLRPNPMGPEPPCGLTERIILQYCALFLLQRGIG